MEYFPYGEIWREPKSDRDGAGVKGQRFLFSGKELDEETGLYYFGARYYDPVRVRWASVDPAFDPKRGPANFSVYAYVRWSPLRFTDPTGLQEAETGSEAARQSSAPQAIPISPIVEGGRLTSRFGNRTRTASDGTPVTRFHSGIDEGPTTPGEQQRFLAPFTGTVRENTPQITIGGKIRALTFRPDIPEEWGMSVDLTVTVRHVDPTVTEGRVTAGQEVGTLASIQSQGSYAAPNGSLVPYSTGPHAHVEARLNGKLIDPLLVLGPTLDRSGAFLLRKEFFLGSAQ